MEGLWISDISVQAMGCIMSELRELVPVFGERGQFGRLKRVDVEGRKWLKEGEAESESGEEVVWREMYPDYASLLKNEILAETEVRCACLERGIEFYVGDSSVEVVFEEYDDVFLFARGDDEEED
jgi:hypothetical protein